MAKEQHLTYFKVENFKRFDSLELTDIGQFNLIVGDNNVGKTSLLEALLVNDDRFEFFYRLQKTLCNKNLHFHPIKNESTISPSIEDCFLKYFFKDNSKKLIIEATKIGANYLTLEVSLLNPSELSKGEFHDIFANGGTNFRLPVVKSFLSTDNKKFMQDQAYLHFHPNEIHSIAVPFVPANFELNGKIEKLYFQYIAGNRPLKKNLLTSLKVIVPNLEDLEVIEVAKIDQLFLGLSGENESRLISVFGDSVVRVTIIILEIIKWKGQRLMIDEIDTGIHYSRMKEFLKTVFKVAELNDVQLFMTTHSLECQQAFVEVFEDPEMVGFQKEVRQFSLLEKPDGQVIASGRTFEQLQHSLEIDFDTRGGRRG